MHLTYTLLLAAATVFLACGEAASGVLPTASVDSGLSLSANVGAEQRSLRVDEGGDERVAKKSGEADLDEDDEERAGGANVFATWKLDEMADSSTKLIPRFKRWVKKGYNPYNLPRALDDEKYNDLRKLFRNYVYKIKGQV